jgi:tetratricopeptide repeat protein
VEGSRGTGIENGGDEKDGAEAGTSDTLTSMCNLATIYWNQARWIEAEQLESQVMQMRKMVLGHIQTR